MTPLKGIRVLDFSKVLAGPLCGQWLGDLGADVVKIEPPGSGDDTRGWPPFRTGGDQRVGAVFLSANRNKRSLTLDLKTEAGQAAARRMAAEADVVIESYATGVAERLGIGAERLCAANPRLIYCSISGFGRTGPLSHGLGYDVILQAFSGIMAMTGERGGGPIRSPFSPIDQSTGMNAFSGILAALLERGRTDRGCRLEVSLFETAAALLGYSLQIYWQKGVLPEKSGSGHESLCPYQAFEASDGPVLIGIASDNLWRRFAAGIGRPELAEDPRFRTNADRVHHFAETVALVQDITVTRAVTEWVEFCGRVGIPCAAINTLAEMLAHPHTAARGIVLDYEHPALGPLKTMAQPIQFNGRPRKVASPPPLLGEHSAEVLAGYGFTPDEISALRAAGAIGEPGNAA
ncbi:CoA transferase [Siccirubricoccus sp. KC 17139]|uniref:CoA transferase n=1 Tax=Siccirubricoccus soli TaxID=2899147 RepID=A0ABT1D247_9PROT|nr:CoA transferase [Siccirubricoccus soli]MCO6416002.1 CoA transferase [Siccirubricoccus soli]MCP2682134.1 CoA transferase [Siccirubricoccus soli]